MHKKPTGLLLRCPTTRTRKYACARPQKLFVKWGTKATVGRLLPGPPLTPEDNPTSGRISIQAVMASMNNVFARRRQPILIGNFQQTMPGEQWMRKTQLEYCCFWTVCMLMSIHLRTMRLWILSLRHTSGTTAGAIGSSRP
jgi:hypothetical protein